MNKFLDEGFFELIKVVPKGQDLVHYFVTSKDIVGRLCNREWPVQNIYGQTVFSTKVVHIALVSSGLLLINVSHRSPT